MRLLNKALKCKEKLIKKTSKKIVKDIKSQVKGMIKEGKVYSYLQPNVIPFYSLDDDIRNESLIIAVKELKAYYKNSVKIDFSYMPSRKTINGIIVDLKGV